MSEEAYASWFSSITQCCGVREKPRHRGEKSFVALREPGDLPAQYQWPQERTYGRQQERRTAAGKHGSKSRGAVSGRRGWFWGSASSSPSASRRPQISAPSNFRHLESGGYQFAQGAPITPPPPPRRPNRNSFRPLELSIHHPEHYVPPAVPSFGDLEDLITPPPPARTHATWDSNSATLTHERSFSSASFHLPRGRNGDRTSTTSNSPNVSPPSIPARALAREFHSPVINEMLERIANAIIEWDRLQDEIDSVVERQSIYANSRPGTPQDLWDIEPVPAIPALPAAGPSFAERLSSDSYSRPTTAPSQKTIVPPRKHITVVDAPIIFDSPPLAPVTPPSAAPLPFMAQEDWSLTPPLAPPLPLVLRPPLRKKKSFSRVSNWLFPGDAGQDENMGLSSVTINPAPVTDRDGFYAPIAGMTRTSVDTVLSVSSWGSEDDDEEEERQTVPTTAWSPGSSPTIKQVTPKHTPTLPSPSDRLGVYEEDYNTHRPTSVGVAL